MQIQFQIGQAGQDEPPRNSFLMVPPLRGNEMKFDLDAQVKHKVIESDCKHLQYRVVINFSK